MEIVKLCLIFGDSAVFYFILFCPSMLQLLKCATLPTGRQGNQG